MSLTDASSPIKSRHLTLITVLIGTLLSTSCASVSVKQTASYRNIEKQRENIVTSNRLSDNSMSRLYTAGIDEQACLANYEDCLKQLDYVADTKQDKRSLALLAELHVAKAKSISNIKLCNQQLSRPPLDPYYANAPLSPEEELERHALMVQCRVDYRYHLIEAIKTSYAYLFFDRLKTNTPTFDASTSQPAKYLPTDADIQTQDIYEYSIDRLINLLYAHHSDAEDDIDRTYYGNALPVSSKPSDGTLFKLVNLKIENNTIPRTSNSLPNEDSKPSSHSASIDIYIPNEPEYISSMKRVDENVSKIYTSRDLNFSGLNFISQREGVGVSYVTLLNDRRKTTVLNLLKSGSKELNDANPANRIHRTGNLLLSGVVIPQGNTLDEVLASNHLDIELYNPHHTEIIDILDEPYYLTANFSASYGVWLSENNLANVGYFSLLSRQQSMTHPQLFMLEPYNPDKRIVIMLHGLASSPSTWVSVTNDILNEKSLRNNYQVWQVFYPTNIPILENRYQIQKLIETAYALNDPQGKDPASKHSVLVGHSMGAVISRLMLVDADLQPRLQQLDKTEQNQSLNKLINKQLDDQNIINRLQLTPLKQVDRAIFMSAPFRGTDYADQWFTLALRRIVELPIGFVQTVKGNLTSIATEGELAANPLGALYLENGASQLSNKSSFIKLTSDLQISDDVTYHSIIASNDDDVTQGIAQMQSSHNVHIDLSQDLTDANDTGLTTSTVSSNLAGSQSTTTPLIASVNVTSKLSDSLAKNLSDGIVPYESSHLEGAASETIISGSHSIQDRPQAAITLRKILYDQLDASAVNK